MNNNKELATTPANYVPDTKNKKAKVNISKLRHDDTKNRQPPFNNNFDNSSPNHNSAEEIMNSELAGRPAARQSSLEPEPELEPEPIPVYRRNSSIMSIEELDELFGVN
ncbi:hypothetical protein C2G38_2153778 [Gigaspora rosea]|uniref:Uncharacterized protein n=1 Tax=Gigaspora rosea TaxID=44941 RepID=A0A397WCT9_9GLOM|nr:hypothetical protein C2G38_2153778 [Gigaspora rosea]